MPPAAKLIPTLVKALKTENSFQYPFLRLGQYVSIQYPADSAFRIFTWQLYVNEDEYRYYGAIQMNSGELKLYPLIDRSYDYIIPEQEVQSNEKWYGALYYNIKEFNTSEGKKYLLFGFDAYRFFAKRKIIDVLTFGENGPRFGAPVFQKMEDTLLRSQHRILLEYSAETSVRLNYDEVRQMVTHDNLIPFGRNYPGYDGDIFVPDGSYVGYKQEGDSWAYVDKLFHHVVDEAPRDQPVLDNRKDRNIFGKRKK